MTIEAKRALVRWGCYLYIAQAMIGAAVGFAIPFIQLLGE